MLGNGPRSSEPLSFPFVLLSDQVVSREGDVHWGPAQRGELQISRDASFLFLDELQRSCLLKGSLTDRSLQVLKAGLALQIWSISTAQSPQQPRTILLRLPSSEANDHLWALTEEIQGRPTGAAKSLPGSAGAGSVFEQKIEQASAKMYFHYYGQLVHQQNMLQDYVRTGTYYAAVLENRADFEGKIVVDVGAGSGILSLFAAQAGAKMVYAIEASDMAQYAKRLAAGNGEVGSRITVVHGKVEEVDIPERADVLISEPMGTLLINERMLETYIIARDKFLKPGGKMFPSQGKIFMAPFADEMLYTEIANKALFWQQQSYCGVDLTPLYGAAFSGYFSQPVVDAFDPRLLVAPSQTHVIDFLTAKEADLYEIDIPLNFKASVATRVHGLACWFDVLFDGSTILRWLSTAPGQPTTHWYQLRCVLSQPLYVLGGQQISGRLHMVAHSSQSYTINLTLSTTTGGRVQTSSGKLDLKEPYYRMSQAASYGAWYGADDQQGGAQQQQQPVQEAPPAQVAPDVAMPQHLGMAQQEQYPSQHPPQQSSRQRRLPERNQPESYQSGMGSVTHRQQPQQTWAGQQLQQEGGYQAGGQFHQGNQGAAYSNQSVQAGWQFRQ